MRSRKKIVLPWNYAAKKNEEKEEAVANEVPDSPRLSVPNEKEEERREITPKRKKRYFCCCVVGESEDETPPTTPLISPTLPLIPDSAVLATPTSPNGGKTKSLPPTPVKAPVLRNSTSVFGSNTLPYPRAEFSFPETSDDAMDIAAERQSAVSLDQGMGSFMQELKNTSTPVVSSRNWGRSFRDTI